MTRIEMIQDSIAAYRESYAELEGDLLTTDNATVRAGLRATMREITHNIEKLEKQLADSEFEFNQDRDLMSRMQRG